MTESPTHLPREDDDIYLEMPDFTLEVDENGMHVVAWVTENLSDAKGLSFEDVERPVARYSTRVACKPSKKATSIRRLIRSNRTAIRTAMHHCLLKVLQMSGHFRRPLVARSGETIVSVDARRGIPAEIHDALRNAVDAGVLDARGVPAYETIVQTSRKVLGTALAIQRQELAETEKLVRERSLLGFSEDFVQEVAPEFYASLPDPLVEPERSMGLSVILAAAVKERCQDPRASTGAWKDVVSERVSYMATTVCKVFRFVPPLRTNSFYLYPPLWVPGSTLLNEAGNVDAGRRDDPLGGLMTTDEEFFRLPGYRERSRRAYDADDAEYLRCPKREARLRELLHQGTALRLLRDSVIEGNLKDPFEALFLDVDGVLIDRYNDETSPVATRLSALAVSGVPIAICSGGKLERIQAMLTPASAYPGLVIYGEHGGKCVQSNGSSWLTIPGVLADMKKEELQALDASYASIAARVDRLDGLSEQSRTLVNTVVPKPESYANSVSSIHRREHGETVIPRAKLARLASEIRGTGDDAIERLPGGFHAYVNGSSVQIIPKVLTKESCLEHYSAMRRGIPGRKDPLGRIMRIGDQGSAIEGRDDRYAPAYLPAVGVDSGMLNCPEGFSTHYESEHGNPPPVDGRTGQPLIRTEATCWLLDRAGFQLYDENGNAYIRLEYVTPEEMLLAYVDQPQDDLSRSMTATRMSPRSRESE